MKWCHDLKQAVLPFFCQFVSRYGMQWTLRNPTSDAELHSKHVSHQSKLYLHRKNLSSSTCKDADKSESMHGQDKMTVASDLALGVHPSISSAAALHAQSLSALLPNLAQGPFQHSLDCGHCIALPPLQLKAPASS